MNANSAGKKENWKSIIRTIQSLTIFCLFAVLAIGNCSCSMLSKPTQPCGVTDYIATDVGTKITGVALPTDEPGKTYNIVTPKDGFWMSLDCHNRMGC